MKKEQQKNRITHYIAALIAVVIGVALDQITKYMAVIHLKDQNPFVIWNGVFELHYLENRGAAFGMLQNMHVFFLFSVIVITIVIVYFYAAVPLEKRFLPLRLCAVAIMAGAYGNCIDRIVQKYVVDFFYFKLINFPIFNVADIYVTVSVFSLVLLIIFYYKEEELERVFHSRK